MKSYKILTAIEYTKQKETIITWEDEDSGKETALSFQDPEDAKKMLYHFITL